MKKTIIALAAASSVALSHGVAVAEGAPKTNTATGSQQNIPGSVDGKTENTQDTETGNGGDNATNPEGNEQQGTTSSTAQGLFGWKDGATPFQKIAAIAAAVTAVVTLLGSISALIANIEKIAKQFTK